MLRSLLDLDVSELFAALRELKLVGELAAPAHYALMNLVRYQKSADNRYGRKWMESSEEGFATWHA